MEHCRQCSTGGLTARSLTTVATAAGSTETGPRQLCHLRCRAFAAAAESQRPATTQRWQQTHLGDGRKVHSCRRCRNAAQIARRLCCAAHLHVGLTHCSARDMTRCAAKLGVPSGAHPFKPGGGCANAHLDAVHAVALPTAQQPA